MKYFVPLIIFILIAALFGYGLQRDPHRLPSALMDKPVPSFHASDLLAEGVQLTDEMFHGHVSLLNVWATGCVACKAEHEALLQIAQDKRIIVYGLNYKDDAKAARTYLTHEANPYRHVLFDPHGKLAVDWGVYGTPESFIIDAKGIIRYKHVGAITLQIWQNYIEPIIKKYQ